MNSNGLTHLYDRLTVPERFRLMLDARARDDEAEIRRLEASCPRKPYMMVDAEYASLHTASRLIVRPPAGPG